MGTHHHGTPEEVRSLDAYIKLARAADTLQRVLARVLAEAGLSTSQLGVLELLYHLGPMCQRDVAEKLLQSGGNVTTVVDNLERRGLVRRERQTQDRRFVTLRLTPDGATLIARVFPGHARSITALMGALTASEQAELGRLCKKLGRGQSRSPEGRQAGGAVRS